MLGGAASLPFLARNRAFATDPQDAFLIHAASTSVLAGDVVAPTLIIAGNTGTGPARWAPLLAPALQTALPAHAPINLRPVAGQDGVTGANLFDSQTGGTALLISGSAVIAALCGDSRVHFDYQRWIPVFLASGAPVVVGRLEFKRSLRAFFQNHPVRVAVTSPTGIELPTLLALTMLSMNVIPVSGLATSEASLAALRKGTVDAVQLPPQVATPETLAALKAEGFEILFSHATCTGDMDLDFTRRPDIVRQHVERHPLFPAYQATAHAAALDAALVLQMLTAPASAALWRHASQMTAEQAAVQATARTNHLNVVASADISGFYSQLTPELSGILALRRWIALNSPFWPTGQTAPPVR